MGGAKNVDWIFMCDLVGLEIMVFSQFVVATKLGFVDAS